MKINILQVGIALILGSLITIVATYIFLKNNTPQMDKMYYYSNKLINKESTGLRTTPTEMHENPIIPEIAADWNIYTDPFHGYSIRYPNNWNIAPSSCSTCAMNLSKKPFVSEGVTDDPSYMGILVFDSSSSQLQNWRNTTVIESTNFSWSNISGEKRIEKRNDFLQLGEEVQMEVMYVTKGSKTAVIYVHPTILPVENTIISTFYIR